MSERSAPVSGEAVVMAGLAFGMGMWTAASRSLTPEEPLLFFVIEAFIWMLILAGVNHLHLVISRFIGGWLARHRSTP